LSLVGASDPGKEREKKRKPLHRGKWKRGGGCKGKLLKEPVGGGNYKGGGLWKTGSKKQGEVK